SWPTVHPPGPRSASRAEHRLPQLAPGTGESSDCRTRSFSATTRVLAPDSRRTGRHDRRMAAGWWRGLATAARMSDTAPRGPRTGATNVGRAESSGALVDD